MMNKPKGSKPNEGYSLENAKGPAKPVSKLINDASGPGSTYGISTAKVTALGQEIDVVRTNNGHYVSRKMIDQLRTQNLAKKQTQAPVHTPAKVVADTSQPPVYTNPIREANNQYISAKPKPGGFDEGSMPPPVKNSKTPPPGDTYGQAPDQVSNPGFYNADSYFQGPPSKPPRKDGDFHQRPQNKTREEAFTETNQYHSKPSFDRGSENADPYPQQEEFPQDTRKLDNSNKVPKKKANKDKDQPKSMKQKFDNSEQKAKEAKRSFQDLQNEQLVEEPNQNFYGSYEDNSSQYGQQTWYGQESTGYYNGQPNDDRSYYPEYQDQYVQDQYPQHEFDPTSQQLPKTSNLNNERSANTKVDKKQPFANKNLKNNDQMAPTSLQRADHYPAKQNFLEKDSKRMDLHQRLPVTSNVNNFANQQPYPQKFMGGSPSMGPKSLNVNSPPVDFEIIGKSLPIDNKPLLPADSSKLQGDVQSYPRGQGQKIHKEQVNPQKQLAVSKEDNRDPNLLADISSIVKCIKRYEDSCKQLEHIYFQQGVELRTQINYDYATFSRDCLNIVRSLLNQVTAKDRPKEKEIQIKKQIEELRASISENQAQINYLMNYSPENKMETMPGVFMSKGFGDPPTDVAQISSIIPASIASGLMMNTPMQYQNQSMMGPNASGVQSSGMYPSQVAVSQANSVVQSEIIKKNLQSGAYGSFIVNPYLQQQSQAAPSYSFSSQPMAYQTAEPYNQYNSDLSYGGLYAPQTQVQPEVYGSLPVANLMSMQMDKYGAQPGLGFLPSGEDQSYPEESQFYGTPMVVNAPVTNQTFEDFRVDVVDSPLDLEESLPSDHIYAPLGSDPRLYGVGGGLFGTLSIANSKAGSQKPAPATEKKGDAAPQENYKSLFSLFTQPSKATPIVARQGMSQEDEESSSHGNLKLYSDDDDAEAEAANDEPVHSDSKDQADQLPQSLEQLLDDDSAGDAKSDLKKQDHHLPIDDISEIITTENRFIQDSHLSAGKDFTLVDDGKQEDAHLNSQLDFNHQFYKNGGTNEGSPVQSRKESQDEQVNLLHANTGDDKLEYHQRLADPLPGAIIAGDLSASKESLDRPSQRKASSIDQKSNLENPPNGGDHSSSSKHDLVRDEQPNPVQEQHDQPLLISKSNLVQDSPVPTKSDTIISTKPTVPDFALNKTSTATPIFLEEIQESSSGRQTLIPLKQTSFSSQQVTPAQQVISADEKPVCSTSNNVESDSNLRRESSLGQNRDLRVTEDQDLAVPTGGNSHAATRAGDRNPDKRLPTRGKSIKDTSALALSEGKDSLGASSDLKREHPRETIPTTLLNDQQVMRLIDIGKRASNKILVLVSKILDGYADSKSRRKGKCSEDSFFTESENPHGLNIFELCTSSEYSACVQRKLSRLKETERIELFYLMKPHLIRLLMDGLDVKIITLELLLFFVQNYHILCRSKAASLFYNYIFESRLFYRYLHEDIVNDLMAESTEVLAEDEASYDFLLCYIRSLTDQNFIGRYTCVLLNFVNLYIKHPRICSLFEELYRKADLGLLVRLNHVFLPVICDLLITQNNSSLITAYVERADDLSLLSIVDMLRNRILYNLVLQKRVFLDISKRGSQFLIDRLMKELIGFSDNKKLIMMFNNPVASANIRELAKSSSKQLINEFAIKVAHLRDNYFWDILNPAGRELTFLLTEFAHQKNFKI